MYMNILNGPNYRSKEIFSYQVLKSHSIFIPRCCADTPSRRNTNQCGGYTCKKVSELSNPPHIWQCRVCASLNMGHDWFISWLVTCSVPNFNKTDDVKYNNTLRNWFQLKECGQQTLLTKRLIMRPFCPVGMS